MELSREELMEFLQYNPETGMFNWKLSPSRRAKVGAVAGHQNGQGYKEIELRGKIYQAHRLAWLFLYGSWPNNEVDHINGVRNDNSASNLRDATKSQNQHNRKRWSRSKSSKLKGVYFHKASGKWTSTIQIDNKRIHLGLFELETEAWEAYKLAATRFHGEFARPEG